jgi:hypothetical protein
MDLRRQAVHFVVLLATAVAAPAFGQTPPPTMAAPAAQSPKSIPDFSGIWVHPFLGFENPESGPGPVRNKSRLRSGVSNFDQLVGDHTNPILKPHAAEIVKKMGEISQSGLAFPDPDNQCMAQPVPYIFWNFEITFLQQTDKITMLYHHDHDYRQIRMNGRHPEKVTPSVHGDSIGWYEGDTLVIDTVGVRVGKHRTLDRFGTPYTEALHVVERYKLVDYAATMEGLGRAGKEWGRVPSYAIDANYKGKGLQLEFTVEDEGVFTMPWKATITYGRAAHTAWEEFVCAENLGFYKTSGAQYYSDPNARGPEAEKPDF